MLLSSRPLSCSFLHCFTRGPSCVSQCERVSLCQRSDNIISCGVPGVPRCTFLPRCPTGCAPMPSTPQDQIQVCIFDPSRFKPILLAYVGVHNAASYWCCNTALLHMNCILHIPAASAPDPGAMFKTFSHINAAPSAARNQHHRCVMQTQHAHQK